MYSAQGIFQHHFQSKKVNTILDKIWYLFRAAPCRLMSVYQKYLLFQSKLEIFAGSNFITHFDTFKVNLHQKKFMNKTLFLSTSGRLKHFKIIAINSFLFQKLVLCTFLELPYIGLFLYYM
jgi:hypothetical protein